MIATGSRPGSRVRRTGNEETGADQDYAVWVGIGALGVALAGIVALGESASLLRLGFLALILAGVVGLKLVEG